MTTLTHSTSRGARGGRDIWSRTAGTIVARVAAIDQALTSFPELVGGVASRFLVAVLTTIRANVEYWAVLGLVGFGLAPGTVDICQVGGGVDVPEVLTEVGVGYEKRYVVFELGTILDALIGVGLG